MKKLLLIMTFPLILSFRGDDLKRSRSIVSASDYFTTDNIGNTYLIKGDQIKKINPQGQIIKVYSNKRLGKIFSVDASNPLRVLVFYKDFSSIVFLDSQLSQNGDVVNLEKYDLEQAELSCTSFNNGIWVYDRQNAQLIRLDENLNKVIQTGNLNRILNLEIHPLNLLEYNGFIYLSDETEGILVFDIYGNYSKTLPFKNVRQFQVEEDNTLMVQNEKLVIYHSKKIQTDTLVFPISSYRQLRKSGNELFFGYPDSISIWSWK